MTATSSLLPLLRVTTLGATAVVASLALAACGDGGSAGTGGAGPGDGDGGSSVTSTSGSSATSGVTSGPSSVSSSASTSTSSTTTSTTTTGSGCVPDTCAMTGAQCGTVPDGCGGTITCGPCPGAMTCNDETNQCECLCGCTDWVKTPLLDGGSPGFSVAVGPDGTEHAVAYDTSTADYALFRRAPGGTFTRTTLPGGVQSQRPGVAVDGSGVAHVAAGGRYTRVEVDGSMTTESIRSMSVARVVVGGDGTVHVVGYDFYPFDSAFDSTVVHAERTPAGVWTDEEIDVVDNPTDNGVLLATIAATLLDDGTLHVAYDDDPVRHAWREPGGGWQSEVFAAGSDSASLDADGGTLRGLYRDAPTIGQGAPIELVQLTGESPIASPIPEELIMTGFSSIDVEGDDIHIAYGVTTELDATLSVLRHGVRGKLDVAYTFEEVDVNDVGARQTHATVVVTPDGPRVYFSKDLDGLHVASRCP